MWQYHKFPLALISIVPAMLSLFMRFLFNYFVHVSKAFVPCPTEITAPTRPLSSLLRLKQRSGSLHPSLHNSAHGERKLAAKLKTVVCCLQSAACWMLHRSFPLIGFCINHQLPVLANWTLQITLLYTVSCAEVVLQHPPCCTGPLP